MRENCCLNNISHQPPGLHPKWRSHRKEIAIWGTIQLNRKINAAICYLINSIC